MSDINQEILVELRKMRRTNQWASAFVIVILVILSGYLVWLKPAKSEWSEVTAAMRQSDYPRALTLAQAVVARRPSDYYGHWYLGKIYLALDDVPHAESEYARAYELNPIDDLRKQLDAIRTRREHEAAPTRPSPKPPA